MQKVRERKQEGWKKLFWLAVFLFCLTGFLPAEVSAAGTQTDTQIELTYNVDVFITGFLSEAPDQELSWKNTMAFQADTAFCLPACADSQRVQMHFRKLEYNKETEEEKYVEETGYVMIDGQKVFSGDTVTLPQAGGKLNIVFSNDSKEVSIKKSANIPAMFINTDSGSMKEINADKSYKEAADMLVVCADGKVDYQGRLKQIKGRGNVTWDYNKRPYNIKLEKSKDILGMGESKGWCLLANYLDTSLLRNKIVYNLADETGIPFNMACESVDFYTNGEYQGTYLLTEKVGIEKNRVNITDMEKATEKVNTADLDSYSPGGVLGYGRNTRKWVEIPNNPEDITGGYLIEVELNDRYQDEACGFVTSRGQAVTMKAPEFVSRAQINYIADFYQAMEDALYSPTGYNDSENKHFSEYIDEESIAKMYLIQEYSLNLDSGITSFYLYKDSDLTGDGKLHMAPVWDFDVAIGNHAGRDGVDLSNPEEWWADKAQIYNIGGLNLLAQAVQHVSVKKQIIEQWNEVFHPAVKALLGEETDYVPEQLKTLAEYEQEISASAEMNFLFWPETLAHGVTGVQNGSSFKESVAYVRNFLTVRESVMDHAFAYGTSGYERLTGTVAIEGTMKVGGTLTAKVSGNNAKNLSYQWMADGEKIEGAVNASYVLTEAEAGKEISVAVRDADGHYLADLKATASEKVPGGNPDPEKPDPEKPGTEEPDPGNTDKPSDETPDKPGQQTPITEQPEVKAPVKLAASAVTKVKSTKNGVKIQFTKVENAASYEVYRKAGSTYTKLGSTKELSYTDKAPVGGKKVFYAVKAVSGDTAKYTDADYGTEKEIRLPKAPQNVKAKALSGRKVLLSWKKVKGASAYLIYRADSKKGTYKLVGKAKKANTVKYTDGKKLKKGKKYYYKIAVLQKGVYSPLGKAVKASVKK